MKQSDWNPYLIGKRKGRWNNQVEFINLLPKRDLQEELSIVEEHQSN
jgi:hypothetical protein